MTKETFYEGLEEFMLDNKHVIRQWRRGQAVFNYSMYINGEVADSLRGSQFDPFYMDSKIERFVDEFCNRLVNTPADEKFYKLVDLLKGYCDIDFAPNRWRGNWDDGYDCAMAKSVEEIKSILKKVGIVWETEQ